MAQHPFTLDNPAHEWFGLGAAARVVTHDRAWPIGVAEVIVPSLPNECRGAVRDLVAALARQGVTATCSGADGPRYGALDLDSNVPDCRIVLGGPDVNPWTARLLAALGPAEELTGRLAEAASTRTVRTGASGTGTSGTRASGTRAGRAGGARVWVPAGRPRGEVFGPDADVRGERDLPVLIVTGPDLAAAVAALAGDLAGGAIEAELAPGVPSPDPPLAGHCVALLNRGTPSSLVSADGTLHIGLMRASSAWPAGVWIDGERRTVPDGSSFAWQHWSHTFEYALAAGEGGWRDAGFTLAGQEYNHDLLTCETGIHAGPLPAAASLCEVTGRSAMLSALKPHGNPLASGRPGLPRREDGVTVRLRDAGRGRGPDAAGQPAAAGPDAASPDAASPDAAQPAAAAPARVRLFTAPGTARLTSLLEDADGPPLPLVDGAAEALVPASGTVTLALAGFGIGPEAAGREESRREESRREENSPEESRPEESSPARPGHAPEPARAGGGPPEPAQPVFSRYWLHGKGPAPAGNLPVAVHLSPGRVTLAADPGPGSADGAPGVVAAGIAPGEVPADGAPLRLTVAGGPQPASGLVDLDVPPGLVVEPAAPLRYELAGGGFAAWDLTARALPGTRPGRYYVAARILDDLGQSLEDATLVTVGEPPAPALDRPLDELLPLLEADQQAIAAEIGLRLLPATMTIGAGRAGELSVQVTNGTAAPVRGECQLISPLGTWQLLGPWTRGFAAEPGELVTLCYSVRLPASARPGSHWWALAKVMYFGRIAYSECARIEVGG